MAIRTFILVGMLFHIPPTRRHPVPRPHRTGYRHRGRYEPLKTHIGRYDLAVKDFGVGCRWGYLNLSLSLRSLDSRHVIARSGGVWGAGSFQLNTAHIDHAVLNHPNILTHNVWLGALTRSPSTIQRIPRHGPHSIIHPPDRRKKAGPIKLISITLRRRTE